ncbi:MAG: DUF2510 domain-containing protein [Humibacillus sp.]|nr:DUF2510 domain-containing protein [Humibacillus sp.]
MRQLRSTLMGLRPWLAALLIWIVGGMTVDKSPPGPSGVATLAEILVFFVGGLGIVRVLWPMRVTRGQPARLVAGGRTFDLYTYTGWVGDHSKLSTTVYRAESRADRSVVDGSVNHTLDVSQRVTVQDGFTLIGADGTQHNVQVEHVNLAVGRGQLVSAAWAIRPGAKRGPYVLFRNHTTGRVDVARLPAWRLATGRGAPFIIICLFVGGLLFLGSGHAVLGALSAFVLPFLIIIAGHVQANRLAGGPGHPLVELLDQVAAGFPTTQAAPAASTHPPPRAPSSDSGVFAPPPPPPGAQVPADWMPDPTARHEFRYWTGSDWSDQVADAGRQQQDPV